MTIFVICVGSSLLSKATDVTLRNLRIYQNSKRYFMDITMDINYIHHSGLSTTWVQS